MTLNLDDASLYQDLDPEDMFARVGEMPDECVRAWQTAGQFKLPADFKDIDSIVILGMGGSAIGGDLLKVLVADSCPVPIIVSRDYELPKYVGARTLVIASSYSGNTEETLAAFEAAVNTDAKKLVITTGGAIENVAAANGVPTFIFSYQAQPRAALPWSLLPLLSFTQQMGLIEDQSGAVREMTASLEKLRRLYAPENPEKGNPAKQLARLAEGKLPVVYGAGFCAEAAHRWKTQFNENGKAWGFYEAFSELNHNAVVGYEFPEEMASRIFVIMLRSGLLNPRQQLRYEITAELLQMARVDYRIVEPDAGGMLSQAMALVMLGDYVTNYMAVLYGTDPSPVKPIDYLKGELKKK